jgi:hypothetical protein
MRQHRTAMPRPLVMANTAIEAMAIQKVNHRTKWLLFPGYVKEPEGKPCWKPCWILGMTKLSYLVHNYDPSHGFLHVRSKIGYP